MALGAAGRRFVWFCGTLDCTCPWIEVAHRIHRRRFLGSVNFTGLGLSPFQQFLKCCSWSEKLISIGRFSKRAGGPNFTRPLSGREASPMGSHSHLLPLEPGSGANNNIAARLPAAPGRTFESEESSAQLAQRCCANASALLASPLCGEMDSSTPVCPSI